MKKKISKKVCVVGAKSNENHWLLLVKIDVLIGQRDHAWCDVCVEEEDSQARTCNVS